MTNKEIAELKAENERLKEELYVALREENRWKSNCNNYRDVCRKQYKTLQEIKEMALRGFAVCDDDCGNAIRYTQILNIINKAEEE